MDMTLLYCHLPAPKGMFLIVRPLGMSTCFLGTGGRTYGSDRMLLVRLICPLSGPTEHTHPSPRTHSKTELVFINKLYNFYYAISNIISILV